MFYSLKSRSESHGSPVALIEKQHPTNQKDLVITPEFTHEQYKKLAATYPKIAGFVKYYCVEVEYSIFSFWLKKFADK